MGDPLRIGVLCSEANGSPKVLGETLTQFLHDAGYDARLFYQAKAVKRLTAAREAGVPSWIWHGYRGLHRRADRRLFDTLATMDAVVLCGATPNAFRRQTFDIARFKARIGHRPVLYYSVQFLGNAPSLVDRLRTGGHALYERFDWHLSVSTVTEIRGHPAPPWDAIGLYLASTDLRPARKEPFLAVVDFARPGYELYRAEQLEVLRALEVPFVDLNRPLSMAAIRDIYRRASLFFLQFPESFGLPIAECLATGAYIVTPDSAWPMALRTDPDPEPQRGGALPECFIVYSSAEDLADRIRALRAEHDPEETPQRVFNAFLARYPAFYEGDLEALHAVMRRVREGDLKHP